MWDTEKFNSFIKALEENDAMRVATWLSQIAADPSHNPDIIPHLEALLSDTRITMVSTPLMYGEIRWNAALALVMERQVQQIGEPTEILKNTFSPMGIPEILFLLSDSNFTLPGGSDWIIKLRGIRNAGNLPLDNYDISFGQEPKKIDA